jgi:hypothetical protein
MEPIDDLDQPSVSCNLALNGRRPCRMRIRWRLLAIAGLCVSGLLSSPTAPAWASCAPDAPTSPHVFTGTVISTEREGRVAHVRTDDGQSVVVVGTPAESGVTSVDRTYEVGVRYEFHPLNATSPFQDNICTRTHAIGSPATTPQPTVSPAPGTPAAGEDGTAGSSRLPALIIVGGGATVAVLVTVGLVRHRLSGSR